MASAEMIVKSVDSPLLIKKFDIEAGEIKAYVTTFGNADLVGDVMDKGAADNFVKQFNDQENASIPMLWEHKRDEIIGSWTKFEVDEKGVIGTGELYKGVSKAEDVKVYLEKGAVGSVSIGFKSSDYEDIKTGGRLFKEIELFETSIVIQPANPQAQIVSAKNEDGQVDLRNLEKALRDAGLSRKEAMTFISAGKSTLRDVVEEELKNEDVMAQLINLYKD
jgi:hypothetical protein